jgi:hypothetical protein
VKPQAFFTGLASYTAFLLHRGLLQTQYTYSKIYIPARNNYVIQTFSWVETTKKSEICQLIYRKPLREMLITGYTQIQQDYDLLGCEPHSLKATP